MTHSSGMHRSPELKDQLEIILSAIFFNSNLSRDKTREMQTVEDMVSEILYRVDYFINSTIRYSIYRYLEPN